MNVGMLAGERSEVGVVDGGEHVTHGKFACKVIQHSTSRRPCFVTCSRSPQQLHATAPRRRVLTRVGGGGEMRMAINDLNLKFERPPLIAASELGSFHLQGGQRRFRVLLALCIAARVSGWVADTCSASG